MFNGGGTWVAEFSAESDRDQGIKILASRFDNIHQNDLKQSFENCLTTNSQTPLVAPFNFFNFKGINLADGTQPNDAVNFKQLDTRADVDLSNLTGTGQAALVGMSGIPLYSPFPSTDLTLQPNEYWCDGGTYDATNALIAKFNEYTADMSKGVPWVTFSRYDEMAGTPEGQFTGVEVWGYDAANKRFRPPLIRHGTTITSGYFVSLRDQFQGHAHATTVCHLETGVGFIGVGGNANLYHYTTEGPVEFNNGALRFGAETRNKQIMWPFKVRIGNLISMAVLNQWDQAYEDLQSSTALAKDWAIKLDGKVVEDDVEIDYSSKYYAQEAKQSSDSAQASALSAEESANLAEEYASQIPGSVLIDVTIDSDTSSTVILDKSLGGANPSTIQMPLPVSTPTNAGVMNAAQAEALHEATSQLEIINSRAFSASGLPVSPAQQDLTGAWNSASGLDISTIASGARISLRDISNSREWIYYTDERVWFTSGITTTPLSYFTNSSGGVIHGSTIEGQVYAEDNGTGSINGWDAINSNVNNKAGINFDNITPAAKNIIRQIIIDQIVPNNSNIDNDFVYLPFTAQSYGWLYHRYGGNNASYTIFLNGRTFGVALWQENLNTANLGFTRFLRPGDVISWSGNMTGLNYFSPVKGAY
jgi:hypothetical protein